MHDVLIASAAERNERRSHSTVRHDSTTRLSVTSQSLLPALQSTTHHASRKYNDSELLHHGHLLKLCSAKLWSKLTVGGYWQTRDFYLHADKTLLNINEHQQLRGKWSLEQATIEELPAEYAKQHEHGFMIQCGPLNNPLHAERVLCAAPCRESCEDWKALLHVVIDHDNTYAYRKCLLSIAELLELPYKSQLRLEILDEDDFERVFLQSVLRHESHAFLLEKTLNSLFVNLAGFVQEDCEFLSLFKQHFTQSVIYLRAVEDESESSLSPSLSAQTSGKYSTTHHATPHNAFSQSTAPTPPSSPPSLALSSVSLSGKHNNSNSGAHTNRAHFRTSFTPDGALLVEVLRMDHLLADCGHDLPCQLLCADGVPYVVHESISLNLAKREHHLTRLSALLGIKAHILCECDTVENYRQLHRDGVSAGKFGYIFYDQVLQGLCENLRNDLYHDKSFGHMVASYVPQRRIRIQPATAATQFVGTMKSSCSFSDGLWLIEYSDANFDPHQVGLDLSSRMHVGDLPYAAWLTVNKENTHREERINRLRALLHKNNLYYDLDLSRNFQAAQRMEIPNVRFGALFVQTLLEQVEKALQTFYPNPLWDADSAEIAGELNRVFHGHRIAVRPMELDDDAERERETETETGREREREKNLSAWLVNDAYRVSFTAEGDLLLLYKQSPLVNFECKTALVQQLDALFVVDGLPYKQWMASRKAKKDSQ